MAILIRNKLVLFRSGFYAVKERGKNSIVQIPSGVNVQRITRSRHPQPIGNLRSSIIFAHNRPFTHSNAISKIAATTRIGR